MPITEVGSNSNGDTGTAISVTHGLTIASGDVVIVLINANDGASISDNNGANSFTEDFSIAYASANFNVWSRVAGASEPNDYAFTLSSSQRWSIIVRVFRGVDNEDIYDVAPAAGNFAEGESVTPSAPSITIANAGAMGLFTAGVDWSSAAFSNPTDGYGTEVEQIADQAMASYIVVWESTGATTTIECTLGGSDNWFASQFSLKPAAPGGISIPIVMLQMDHFNGGVLNG